MFSLHIERPSYMVIFQNNVEKFHGAIKTGSAETVRSVLQNSSSPELVINARNKVSVLPLTFVEKFHGAIKTGSAETVRSVLQNSSSP